MTVRELDIVCNAAYVAYGRLIRDGVYTSPEKWRNMMRRLERAWKIIEKERRKDAPITTLHLREDDKI